MLSEVQKHNLDMVEEIKETHQRMRKGGSPEIRNAIDKASIVYQEAKRQGALKDPRKFEAVRRKVLDRL